METMGPGDSKSNIDPLSTSNLESHENCPINNKSGDTTGNGYSINSSRSKKEIAQAIQDGLPGITAVQCENIYCTQVLIIGTADTPYEGGFFHFFIRFGPQYPAAPPQVCSMTSYRFGQAVRFSPNLYSNGLVCLSLLGTWHNGPTWEASRTLTDVLLGLQSLFKEQSLCNEPGYESLRDGGGRDVWAYDLYCRHETIRVAVIETIRNATASGIPEPLVSAMTQTFLDKYEFYLNSCDSYSKYDGSLYLITTAVGNSFTPKFGVLKQELMSLHNSLTVQAA